MCTRREGKALVGVFALAGAASAFTPPSAPIHPGLSLRRPLASPGRVALMIASQPRLPPTPPPVVSDHISGVTRPITIAKQGQVLAGDTTGVFPATTPFVQLADAAQSDKAALVAVGGASVAALIVAGIASMSQAPSSVSASSDTSAKLGRVVTPGGAGSGTVTRDNKLRKVFVQLSKATDAAGEPLMTKDCMKRAFDKLAVEGVTEDQAQKIFDALDTDSSGTICFAEFQSALNDEIARVRNDPNRNPLTASLQKSAKAAKATEESAEEARKKEAAAYDKSREEQLEIDRIKNDFLAKLELAGRQSTIRLATMGEGIATTGAPGAEGSKPSSLPDEVYIPPKP